MDEALDQLTVGGIPLDAMRLRAFPFPDEVLEFIDAHEEVFVVEQNRDGQMRTLLMNELNVDAAQAGADPALRRHADHRALHHRRDHAPGACRDRDAASQPKETAK